MVNADTVLASSQSDSGFNQQLSLSSERVHFFFARTGPITFQFSPHYSRELQAGDYFLIYDQEKALPVQLSAEGCKMVYLRLRPDFIHDTLLADKHHVVHFDFQGFGVREYSVKPIGFEADRVLESFFADSIPTSLETVYYQAKVLELLSHIFDAPADHLYEACPFLKDKDNVEKIKQARNILVENMLEPPKLKDLAREIGMNEYNLKIGFRNVYGLPPFKYLQEYKLTYSQQLLRQGQMHVSEIAYAVGYTSASHYIEAFCKRFGSTPKKFMTSSGE